MLRVFCHFNHQVIKGARISTAVDFPSNLVPLLLEHMRTGTSKPVVNFKDPTSLYDHFQKIGVPLKIGNNEPTYSHERLLRACASILECSVNTTSPLFNNQLYGTVDPIGVAGDWMVAVANANSHTYEVAPVFTLLELELISKFSKLIGGDFSVACDGLFVPGGAISNIYALHLARYRFIIFCFLFAISFRVALMSYFRMFPAVKTEGNGVATGLVAFTSDEAHYS